MKKTKIDWCDCTINPVVGCKRGCKYCYADRMNTRMHFVPNFKEPQFFPSRLDQFDSKKPRSVFLNSMSDIEYWDEEWCGRVVDAIKQHPQHKYIFLTKGEALPYELFYYHTFEQNKQEEGVLTKKTKTAIMGQNMFAGKTITRQADILPTDWYNFDFLSIEPLHERLGFFGRTWTFHNIKQVIIGAETGKQTGKIVPQKEWVDDIVKECDRQGARVFMKESLRGIMGDDFRQDELIWAIKNCKYEPDIDYPCNQCSSDCWRGSVR